MKKTNYLLIGLLLISAVFAFYPQILNLYHSSAKVACEQNSQFRNDAGPADTEKGNIINESGTIRYFRDDFSGYAQNSKIIDQFDNYDNLKIKGGFHEARLDQEKISGEYSFSFENNAPGNQDKTLTVRKKLAEPLNLSRWKHSGIVSLWMKIENRKGILAVGLKLGDKNNNFRDYGTINNLQIDIPNSEDDDAYPDIDLSDGKTANQDWTDFWLNKGWNYLFWRGNPANFSDSGNVDMDNIVWFELTLNTSGNIAQKIMLDNLRIQDGIQKEANALGGVWHTPENKPQFGIFDLDFLGKDKSAARLTNVRQTQYPTNGDHGRMVLKHNAPTNFSLRTRFQLTDLPKTQKGSENSWFRIAYDFDPLNDPGHDWFGAFISFEWKKFGLTTVIPIEKDNVQTWEPKNENVVGASVDFTPSENTVYEIHLTARGQNAEASIYEVRGDCLILRAESNYTFQRSRHGEDRRYPFCLEVTGNLKANILDFEVKEL